MSDRSHLSAAQVRLEQNVRNKLLNPPSSPVQGGMSMEEFLALPESEHRRRMHANAIAEARKIAPSLTDQELSDELWTRMGGPSGFLTPIRCHACSALVVWLKDGSENGVTTLSETNVRHPDGSEIGYGEQKRCPSCRAGFMGIDAKTQRTVE